MKNSGGFTIIEVLVAVLVLAVGLLGSLSIFVSATRFFNAGHASVEATASAAAVLEMVRGGRCTGSTVGSGIAANGSYTWIIEEINPELRGVTVIVRSGGVRARIDTFSAVVAC